MRVHTALVVEGETRTRTRKTARPTAKSMYSRVASRYGEGMITSLNASGTKKYQKWYTTDALGAIISSFKYWTSKYFGI